jgi:DNA-directed RNA polymerase subunit RPC12/RpoP
MYHCPRCQFSTGDQAALAAHFTAAPKCARYARALLQAEGLAGFGEEAFRCAACGRPFGGPGALEAFLDDLARGFVCRACHTPDPEAEEEIPA